MMFTLLMTMHLSVRPVDDALIAEIAAGNKNAFAALYEHAADSVYGFALSITKNTHDAEDVLQETFLRVYEKATDYRPAQKPMAWVLTIARNLALDKIRTRSRLAELDEHTAAAFATLDDTEERMLLQGMLEKLEDEEKQIVMLHALSGLKHREIAALIEKPLGSVLSSYHRAIKKLQNLVKEAE